MGQIAQLKEMLEQSKRIVFLGGAGVSTESGIPDFRSENGIFQAISKYGHEPETLLSYPFFIRNPDVFYAYYRDCLLYPDAKPNDAHYALAELERQKKLTAVVTQNIDDLHQRAGSKNVLEVHGSLYRNYCMNCGKKYSIDDISNCKEAPRCDCGGLIRPDIVMYGEMLNEDVVDRAIRNIQEADLLIVGGTSLVVYPAAGLINYFHGRDLVIINKSITDYDNRASLVIHDSIGKTLKQAILEE